MVRNFIPKFFLFSVINRLLLGREIFPFKFAFKILGPAIADRRDPPLLPVFPSPL